MPNENDSLAVSLIHSSTNMTLLAYVLGLAVLKLASNLTTNTHPFFASLQDHENLLKKAIDNAGEEALQLRQQLVDVLTLIMKEMAGTEHSVTKEDRNGSRVVNFSEQVSPELFYAVKEHGWGNGIPNSEHPGTFAAGSPKPSVVSLFQEAFQALTPQERVKIAFKISSYPPSSSVGGYEKNPREVDEYKQERTRVLLGTYRVINLELKVESRKKYEEDRHPPIQSRLNAHLYTVSPPLDVGSVIPVSKASHGFPLSNLPNNARPLASPIRFLETSHLARATTITETQEKPSQPDEVKKLKN